MLDNFHTDIAAPVYDVVELATKVPLEKRAQIAKTDAEIRKVKIQIEALKNRFDQAAVVDQQIAQLSQAQILKAQFLQNALAACPRMTTCQLNAEGGLLCGGVVLKSGDSRENLQANWDLIDTVTGADA